jgi:hypothetical protein
MTAIAPTPGLPHHRLVRHTSARLDAAEVRQDTAVVEPKTTYALIKARWNEGLWTRTDGTALQQSDIACRPVY